MHCQSLNVTASVCPGMTRLCALPTLGADGTCSFPRDRGSLVEVTFVGGGFVRAPGSFCFEELQWLIF